MKLTTLQSLVSAKTASLYSTDTISRAMEVMGQYSISSVVITDEAERPIGIFTERDALRAVANEIDTAMTLGGVMSPDPFCMPGSVQMHDAYLSMEEKGFRPGMVSVIQTFGEGAKFHPHVHALCSRGGWTASGEWIPLPYVDEAAAEKLFRHKVLALLRRRGLLSQERIAGEAASIEWLHSESSFSP